MKKIILLIFMTAIFYSVQAQHFVTSVGVELGWNLPGRVSNSIYNNYRGYDIVHVDRFYDCGIRYYDVVLQRGKSFVQVSYRNNGYARRRVITYNNPLNDHICRGNCGYHANYYAKHIKKQNKNSRRIYAKGNQRNNHDGRYRKRRKSENYNNGRRSRNSGRNNRKVYAYNVRVR